jgi:hypothetical protein
MEARKRKGREKEGRRDFKAGLSRNLGRELGKTQPQGPLNGKRGMLEWKAKYLTPFSYLIVVYSGGPSLAG